MNFVFAFSVFFAVQFFASSFSLLLSSTSLRCTTLAAVSYIPELESGFIMEVSSFSNLTFFWFIMAMNYFFISWIGMTVIFLTVSYDAAQRIMLLDDCWVPFSRRTTIGSSVLVTCNLIGATIWYDILFISSTLASEDTCMEAAHDWVFVVKFGRISGG